MPSEDVAAAYLTALEGGDAPALVGLLGPQPRFVSPFSVWSTPESVAAACTARCRAFADVTGVLTLPGDGDAVVRWHGLIGEREVEGVDVLALDGQRISGIDVFLRPADVLDTVYAAMAAAWPATLD